MTSAHLSTLSQALLTFFAMKKDSFFNQLISTIAGLGVPGLVLLVVTSASGFAGAAALTTGLAALGGPFGMVGGIALLGVLAMIVKGLTEYGLDALFNPVLDELRKSGLSDEDVVGKVNGLPIPRDIKKMVVDMVMSSGPDEEKGKNPPVRIFWSQSADMAIGKDFELIELHSAIKHSVLIIKKTGAMIWEGVIVSSDATELVKVLYKNPGLREFISSSRSLAIGERYNLEEEGTGVFAPVLIEVKVDEGFWLGKFTGDRLSDDIVNIVYKA